MGTVVAEKAEKKIKLPIEMVEAIEVRLTLPGGTTVPEVGADLANRFGAARIDYNKKMSGLSAARIALNEKREKRNNIEKRYKEERMKEVAKFGKTFMDYIISTYGPAIKNEMGLTIMYGDNIEVSARKHFHRIL